MKITPTFLQPQRQASSCPQPYAPEKAVRYDPEHDGDSVADFEASDKGKRVKAQYRVGLEKLKTFLASNGDSSRNDAAVMAIGDFGAKVEAGTQGFFSTQAGRLYDHGKGALDTLCVDVEDSRIPIAERQAVLRNLAVGLDVCSEGACSNLIIAADNLRLSVQGPRGHAKRVWEDLFDQAIAGFSQHTHGHHDHYDGNEIHYVNGYRNYFSRTLGLTERPDSFVQQQEIEPHLEAATRFVNEAVTADALVRHLAESCLAEVREHFQHYLDRPLTETETGECYQKYESIDASLQSRYGKIECHLLINADEDRGTEDAPYTVIDKPDLLMRAIALNLRQAGVLEREKFKTEASQAAAGDQPRRQIKRITDDAYYVKEQVAGQSHARYRSLHPADLHSFNLSKERAGKILKSTLMSTTDRDQLCLLDQSSVWDLITDPHAGFPEDASQWLGALAHFAVKRYRQANPTANEFLLLKAQGKIAGQDPLHQQRDLVTLMEMGEESLAVRVASALTTFDWCEEESKDTLLHWAVRKGCDKVLKELASKMNVNVTNAEKATPLMVAAERVDAAVCVEALLQKGANTDLADKDGMTALMTAAKHGVDASVCALLNHDANADLQDRHGWNALHLAAMSGHPFIAERLANAVGDVNQTGGPYGETALMAAARHDHVEVVRKLLHSSPNLNLTNEEGCSAFHSAARCGQIEILEELGPHMTSVDEPTPLREMTALMLAVENGHADAVRALMNFRLDLRRKNRGGFNAIHIAALHGQATILQLLKDRFPDNEIVNDFNNDHETPLMLAARSGQADAVRWLLANKADGSLRNEMGEKAFHLAAACGHSDIVRILRSSMVDLDELSGHGDTALMLAAAHGYTDTVRMLLTLGSNVQTPCENGWTALHCAVSKSRVEVAEVLIDAKADVNAVTQNKTTPMLLAILEQCQPMIQLLTRKGGKLLHLNTPDENGRTHLMRAVSDERWSDFDALVEAGAWMAAAELDSPEEDIDLLASDDPFSWLLE